MSALTEKIAAEHFEVLDSEGKRTGRCYCGEPGRGYPGALTIHIAEVTEAAVREHIAAELENTAREYNATYLRMNDAVIAGGADGFGRDDVIRYGAYSSAWSFAARAARTPTKEQ